MPIQSRFPGYKYFTWKKTKAEAIEQLNELEFHGQKGKIVISKREGTGNTGYTIWVKKE